MSKFDKSCYLRNHTFCCPGFVMMYEGSHSMGVGWMTVPWMENINNVMLTMLI